MLENLICSRRGPFLHFKVRTGSLLGPISAKALALPANGISFSTDKRPFLTLLNYISQKESASAVYFGWFKCACKIEISNIAA